MNEIEVLAGFKVLLCIAKADGVLKDNEKEALAAALAGIDVPGGARLEQFLDEPIDLEAQALLIQSFEARVQTYHAARSMALIDGDIASEEKKLLKKLRDALKIETSEDSWLDAYVAEIRDTARSPEVALIEDPEKRAAAIREEMLRTSVIAAMCGAFPLPGLSILTDLAVIFLQASMAKQIASRWGRSLDGATLHSLLGTIAGGVGLRLAINTVVKLVPVLGSAVGAASAFASTWAIGKVVDQYFASGGKLEPDAMRALFKQAVDDGKTFFKSSKTFVEERGKALEPELRRLAESLKRGELSPAQYNEKIRLLK